MPPTSILVTGGAGFIGSHLVARLLEHGDAVVTVLDDFNDFYDPALKRMNLAGVCEDPNFRLIEGDLLDAALVEAVFESVRFDAVIHLAARAGVRPSLAEPLLYQAVNVEGTYRLLELARQYRIRKFVFASSSSVYGARSRVPFVETDPVQCPASPYAATKIAGEHACYTYASLYDIRAVCLRFFTVYGPRQRPDLAIRTFTELLSRGEPITLFGDGSTSRDYTYVDDVVDCVERALGYDRTPFEVVNIGNENPVELRRLVAIVGETLGVEPEIVWAADQPGDVPRTYADITKARELFDFVPRIRIEEGIARFVDWHRRTGSRRALAAAHRKGI